jgi:citrate lyase synthetase
MSDIKATKPLAVFNNGGLTRITKISLRSVSDNLVDSVTFKYVLFTDADETVGEGEVSLDASNYSTWDASARGAYQIVCGRLGLELV